MAKVKLNMNAIQSVFIYKYTFVSSFFCFKRIVEFKTSTV